MFSISHLPLLTGKIGFCPIPGLFSFYERDLEAIIRWRPELVITLTHWSEIEQRGIEGFPEKLKAMDIDWIYFPIEDYGVPKKNEPEWAHISTKSNTILRTGGRVLCHCNAGCGRSGMIVLRIMCEAGETADQALQRLRKVKDCAVETNEQLIWATEELK